MTRLLPAPCKPRASEAAAVATRGEAHLQRRLVGILHSLDEAEGLQVPQAQAAVVRHAGQHMPRRQQAQPRHPMPVACR